MSFATLSPEEKLERYVRERRRVFELRRHLRNANRAMENINLRIRVAHGTANQWRNMYNELQKAERCNLPTPHVRGWLLPTLFLLGMIVGGFIEKFA